MVVAVVVVMMMSVYGFVNEMVWVVTEMVNEMWMKWSEWWLP